MWRLLGCCLGRGPSAEEGSPGNAAPLEAACAVLLIEEAALHASGAPQGPKHARGDLMLVPAAAEAPVQLGMFPQIHSNGKEGDVLLSLHKAPDGISGSLYLSALFALVSSDPVLSSALNAMARACLELSKGAPSTPQPASASLLGPVVVTCSRGQPRGRVALELGGRLTLWAQTKSPRILVQHGDMVPSTAASLQHHQSRPWSDAEGGPPTPERSRELMHRPFGAMGGQYGSNGQQGGGGTSAVSRGLLLASEAPYMLTLVSLEVSFTGFYNYWVKQVFQDCTL